MAEEGTRGGVDFNMAEAGAEGGTRIKGTTSKEISRGTIIKETIHSKATSTIIVIITVQVGATGTALPRDEVTEISKISQISGVKIPKGEETRMPRGITSNRSRFGPAHRAILVRAGAVV